MGREAKKSEKIRKLKVVFFRRGMAGGSWVRTQKVVRSKNSPGKASNLPNRAAVAPASRGSWGGRRESTETAHAVGSAGRSRLGKRAGACEKIRRAGLLTGPREVAWRVRAAFFGSRRTYPRRPTLESPYASARRAAGLARVPRVRSHAPMSIGPVRVHRTDACGPRRRTREQ